MNRLEQGVKHGLGFPDMARGARRGLSRSGPAMGFPHYTAVGGGYIGGSVAGYAAAQQSRPGP